MKPIIEDFVNRTDQLTFLWEMVHQKVDPRILVFEAEDGMGKTYLLKEFRAECQDQRLEVVSLDFEERYEDPGYMYVIKETWSQLGPVGFDLLAKTIEETVAMSLKKDGQSGWQALQSEQRAAPEIVQETTDQPVAAGTSPGGQRGGVNIYAGTNTLRDVAGRDINHFIQVINLEDPFVQTQARTRITEAFRQCMALIASERNIVFFIDHWQKAETETRRWLDSSVVKWTSAGLLLRACVVIAGREGVELEPRRLLKRIPLPELDEASVQLYLVDIYGLPAEEVPNFIRIAGGMPFLLNMALKRRHLPKSRQ